MKDLKSPNFEFLKDIDPALTHQAAMAERYCLEDPNAALTKLRLFGEMLAKNIAARCGIYTDNRPEQSQILRELKYQDILDQKLADMFHSIRIEGNAAVHDGKNSVRDALRNLRFAHQLAVWFYRTFKNSGFRSGPFKVPPNPANITETLQEELDLTRSQILELQGKIKNSEKLTKAEIKKREKAEAEAAKAWEEINAALELAQQVEEDAQQEIALYEEELSRLQARGAKRTEKELRQTLAFSRSAAERIDLTEADTRKLIDQKLRAAGWDADSDEIRYSKGIRPEKGKNKAIAEWPVKNGRADYVLFTGLSAIAVVEAKRRNKDVYGAIDQAKRYSRGFQVHKSCETAGGPWGTFKIPFVFATNGRPFLRQMKNQSGIWFCDVRRPRNLRRPLESWYTPEGLKELARTDIDKAEQNLDEMSFSFEFPLRDYQKSAILAVERAIKKGRQTALLAMATGTGKTKTSIALLYRLLRAQRFRRILFLVDREALGEQAANAFKDTEITGLQKFADIFAIKELKEKTPDQETAVHFATIQGMVSRILYAEDEADAPKVDQYDCIVVDECHRGYLLDREMGEAELSFRSYEDYISKYRRVLDYFDAFKVGLTATPALHTTEIFGRPVFTYSYREAVIDGYLVDHEPPFRIITKLSRDGIHWEKGEQINYYNTDTGEIDLSQTPDELDFEVADFNKKVLTENFNRELCEWLAKEIDPGLPEKTLVFCVRDTHADLVTRLLKDAFEDQYGAAEDDAVLKITGKSDKPLQLIRRYKNERLPNVAVTVDLLTTGIDVLPICNIVFLRKVNSRILYEQMLGRATRRCDDINKEVFRIFDAVDIYSTMKDYSDMKPVVNRPNITFAMLEKEILTLGDEAARLTAKEQFFAKFQRRKRYMDEQCVREFETRTDMKPDQFIARLSDFTPEEAADWFAKNPGIGELLDTKGRSGPSRVAVSDHEDEVTEVSRGYGKPGDYIDEFSRFIKENINEIAALKLVVQRPAELTRKQLKELQLNLEENGYREQDLKTAYKAVTNADIAANIMGFIRQAALGYPLKPYEQRVDEAVNKILASRDWSRPQKQWLQRIAAQMKKEIIVDQEAMNRAQFREVGGFKRINKIFNGELAQILEDITEQVWEKRA
ncbi:type I restriction-modification system endonuclease [Desulfococcaceae bacterium HSG8]|nr:type I restriction-modification system endonuclease [Desulfococcaceae bacterium HSG8]